jgi:cathepsin A (carboxypeptidase C)
VKKPVFNETRCDIMAANIPRCISVMETCYERPDAAICTAASEVCWEGVIKFYDGESYKGGRNRFDSGSDVEFIAPDPEANFLILVTAPCDMDDLCYINSLWIEEYLNTNSVFVALGVPPEIKNYSISSIAVQDAFVLTEDLEISMMPQLEYVLANQIDVLIYQGNLDLACNTAGAKRWTAKMPWKGQAAFTSQELKPWKSVVDGKEKVVGQFKEVNVRMVEGDEKKTRFALVTIDGSGHMVC